MIAGFVDRRILRKHSIFFVAVKIKSFQGALAHRNDLIFTHLECEVFCKFILDINFLRIYHDVL